MVASLASCLVFSSECFYSFLSFMLCAICNHNKLSTSIFLRHRRSHFGAFFCLEFSKGIGMILLAFVSPPGFLNRYTYKYFDINIYHILTKTSPM